MKYKEYAFVTSVIAQLENLLDRMSPDMVVERMGVENRLKKARAKIAGIELPSPPKEAHITFKGKPVLENEGITSDFGAKAVALFSDIVTTAAAGFSGRLKEMGPIPDRNKNEPMLTGIATGSFGFTLEIPSEQGNQHYFERENNAEEALKAVQHLLEQSTQGSDETLSELASEIHPRAVKKVHDLLTLIGNNEAWFALEFENHEFEFSSPDQVLSCAKRIGEQNIQEDAEVISGELQGLMLRRRRFELQPFDRPLIEGRLGPEISDSSTLLQLYLDKAVTCRMTTVRIGRGNPRYTLREILALE